MISSNCHRYINIVARGIPITTPTMNCIYDSGIHEFDISMENISIGIAQKLMVDRLIINLRVNKTGSGYATYTDKQHHGISAYLLAIKWGIALDKVKNNLQYTTHDNVRSVLKPLTRRYRKNYVAEAILTKLQVLHGHTISKVHVYNW